MWEFWLKCFLVVIFGILETNSGGDPFSRQPRIVVENGHLVIRSAFNRNVTLSSTGQGAVQINNVDMGKTVSSDQASGSLEAVTMTSLNRRMNQLLGQWRSINDLVAQVNQLEDNVTDIVQRMNQFVGSDQNRITNRAVRRYFAKVKALEDKVNHLTELLSTNECSSNPCRNGGKCVDSYNGFVCNCPPNWEGQHCDNDVNECALYSGTARGCQNGATCINLQGSYRCDCPPNRFGIHCSEQHDDCSTASHQELCDHGTCVDEKRVQPGQPKYRCICDPGWTVGIGTPACSQDIDECQMAKCSMSPPVTCINLPGSFFCSPCPAGYTGNGMWCADINECENQNGGCSQVPFVECHNTLGSRRCGPCPTGFFGNGEQCVYQSVCNNNRGGCHPLATCIENPSITTTYRECRCPPGYIGNGEGLTGCVQGQSMSCASNPCQHGTCQMVGQLYHCVCPAGYRGQHCEIAEDPCFRAPCLNGGTCVQNAGTFSCICVQGYSGPTCSEQRNECGGYLIGNNGTLSYPEYNHHYDHNENCGWVIVVDPGKVVNVTFDHFELEPGNNCEFDFLQLNDGPNAGSRPIGRYCSDHLHGETFTSTHNRVYLWFHTDRSISATGFTMTWEAVDPVCGGELNVVSHGSVQSPGYPGLYPVNRTCSWLLQVPFGQRIQFSFATLQLEEHQNCSFDYLKLYDGATDRDPVIGTYCSRETPPPIITSGHSATLLFHSDDSLQDTGFNIAFSGIPGISGCGGTITQPQGSITSPSFPDVYLPNLLCEWLIRIHPDNRLKITFTEFHLEFHSSCSFDSLEIYDGSSDSAPPIGRFCGTNLPMDIMSNSNQLYIRFKTDASQNHPGFKLDFRTICGGVYTDLTGVLTSPLYPEPYPMNTICLYEIRLPIGYLVNLTIHNINIEPHYECRFDSLEIRDGNSATSPVSALLCGNTAPDNIVSTYNHLWMKFETDGSVQNLGFSAQYEAIDIGCGGVMVDNNGQISSPRHPDSYPHSTTCTWLIRAPEGSIIRLSFSTFVLEEDQDCTYDYVLIEDINGVPIGRYCGTTKPPIITSLDNTLLLKFVADASIARDGFIADYSFHDASESCGGTFYQESGIIRSPGYPKNSYPHHAHCVWILQAPNNRQITLNINNFTLEHHTECRFDYLEIRNGGNQMSPLIGKYCGNEIMPTIQSHSNLMRLEFQSDSSMSAPGFEISFDSSTVGCGGTLVTARGSIASPNYPQAYPFNADCLWLIRVSEGSTIILMVIDIDIEEHDTCQYDYLQIFDGNSENSKPLARLCNNQQNMGQIQSTGNTMLLRFRSDSSYATGGFHVVYNTLCNNVLTKRRGVIESPNFPNPYPHNHNCSWVIQAPPGSNISMAFSHIFIEATYNCSLDYVEVLEMIPTGNRSLGRFCGDMSRQRETIRTSTNTAVVRLITDRSVSREGFRLEWAMEGCGGDIINRPYINLVSPNYPSGYPIDTTCYWRIWYPPGSRVEFTMNNMDIEGHPNCDYDFVKLYGGEDADSPLLRTFCNSVTEKPEVITSPGNQIFVHFHSDYSIARGGFRAIIKRLDNGCGGRLTGQEANFFSPNYPYHYNETDVCEWLIEVSSSNLVMLQFYDFEMPQSANCTHGFVAVYDGNNSTAPPLLKHCGAKPEGFISSTSNQMLVRLVADGSNVAKGFKAHYKQGCGRRLLADAGGVIQSPNYPDGYVGFSNCSWILYASDLGEKVSLTITHLFIPEFDNCTMSLLVYDGDREDSPKIAEHCGHKAPPPIVSRGSIMHVMLKNNGIFRATYGLLSEHCGGSFTSASGYFASPGYPTNYDLEMECVWTIEASQGNKVHVTFQVFNLEESDYCNSDYLEIHEDDPSGPLIGKFCGNSIPSNVTWARKLWIKFRSDDIGTSHGFLAHYELQHGSIINGTSGFIESPGYPHKFQKDDIYEWTVIVPQGKFISLQFLEMAIMNHQGNCYTFVQIYDGIDEGGLDLGQYCGYQLPDPMVSTTNVMTIQFHSQLFYPSQFVIHWAAVDSTGVSISFEKNSNCSEEYILTTTDIVNITSPEYPSNYAPNLNCTYLIRTPNTHHVQLNILNMNIEAPMPNCQFDRLESYYAPNTNIDSWILNTTLCERRRNVQLTSPNNMMKLMFITDHILHFSGFQATASAACGGQLFGDSGSLHSSAILPHIQNLSQSENFQCEWVITVKPRRTMQITFQSFNIQSDNVCDTNYILLRNGAFSTSPILGTGRYCGQRIPTIPVTSSNNVYIQVGYNTASSAVPRFDLHYTEVSTECGGHFFLSSELSDVQISSPNPPNHDIECDWIVISPAGTTMRIDFNDAFQLDPNCWSDNDENVEYVQLYDGGTENAPVLQRYCHYAQPSSEMTTGNALLVRYVTAVPNPKPGFVATVRIAQCGGTISAFHSIIKSPQYPEPYGKSIECKWYLKMKYGYHITLTVTDFETPPAQNCSMTDFLEIREMTPEGIIGDVIRTICGTPNNLPLTIEIPGSAAYMEFKSNSDITAKGFSVTMQSNYEEGCSGLFDDPSGVITSPRYPNAFPAHRDCHWQIYAPEDRRVKITFEELNLPRDETLGTCTSFVAIFNSTHMWRSRYDFTHQFCGNNIPEEIDTTTSIAYVVFYTTGLSAGQGFKLRYSTEEEGLCGAFLSGLSGSIQTPTFPVQNDTYINCRWRAETEANKTLAFKFSTLHLPGNRANFCRDGYLRINTGPFYYASMCGNYSHGLTMATPYASTTFRLFASLEKPFPGIQGTYNTSDCGGVIDGYNTVITSPGYPNNYPPGVTCCWVIKVPYGEVIRLTVVDLNLEEDCTKDYLMIRNGVHMESPMLGKFCGSHNPAPVVSSWNILSVIFHTDEFGTAPGFNLTSVEIQKGCGGLIHALQGNFTSPNYPSRYDNNVECMWTIEFPLGYLVKVSFLGRFEIETDATCSKDYLQFENLENGQRLGDPVNKCGSAIPDVFISKTNNLRIMFHSNALINGDGFNLMYSAACGGNFTNQNGDILSPNYPDSYSNLLVCKYYIGKLGDLITLTFDDYFSVEGHDSCIYDYVQLFQKEENDSYVQGPFCGTIPPAPRTLQGPIILKFVTDSFYVADGFKVHYDTLSCGGILTGSTGVITSPPVTQEYNQDIDCIWHIEVEKDSVIALRFTHLQLDNSYSCWRSYIAIYNGYNVSAPPIGKICGQDMRIVKSIGPQLTIRYYKGVIRTSQQNSFSAYYYKTFGAAQGCGGTLNTTSGYISSMNVDGSYVPDLDCGWTILANIPDQVIKLTFNKFDLEGPINGSCSYDYLEIRERGANGPFLSRYCGSNIPTSFVTSSNQLFIHFHSNGVVSGTGFNISYSVIQSPCGTSALIASPNEQTLSSPNYPSPYPVNLQCKWNFYLNYTGHRTYHGLIQISINDMDVPCDGGAYIQIRKYNELKRYCGPQHTEVFHVFNGADIIFNSGPNNNTARGFTLTYRQPSCSRNYTDEGGTITNSAFPTRYNAEARCLINITAAAGKTIALYFKVFDLPSSAINCGSSFLKAYDGENVNATSLGVYCGYTVPNPIFSTARSLFLDINLNNKLGRYHITYVTTDKGQGCGGKVYGEEGAIASPFYPQAYNQSAECVWHITVPGYHTVKLEFISFSFNSTTGCNSNYVEIFEGATDDVSSRFARYCGQDVPSFLSTRSNQAVVKLVTDSSNTLSGFLLHFNSSTYIADPSVHFVQNVLDPDANLVS